MYGGDIYVPYAIFAESSIITVFDPTIHRPTDNADVLDQISSENEGGLDHRSVLLADKSRRSTCAGAACVGPS